MGSEGDCGLKGEMDDSGCVQDATMQSYEPSLMDMPDDVLLYILKCCSAADLKALAYCCTRLCCMAQERTLWRHVDARSEQCSRARLRWYLDNMLQDDTRTLMLTGYAKDMEGCLGFMNVTREEGEKAKCPDSNSGTDQQSPAGPSVSQHRKIFAPRCSGMPTWGDNELGRGGEEVCIGPQFSLSQALLRQLAATCPQLAALELEFCNIDCRETNLGDFPKTLKCLSLRGSRCYNMVMDKTFLFRINFFLPYLQILDVSECEWLDPATLLPLSKLADLSELYMRDCPKLTEFVAYASLTARYGFKTLKALDLRGSPVGDSEISALGWLPSLERLWLARTHKPRASRRPAAHAHYLNDPAVKHVQLHPWEEMEPHLLRVRPNSTYYYYDDVAMEFSEREREGLKRKPEEKENEEMKRSPKRIREDIQYNIHDNLVHLRSRFFMNIKNVSRTNGFKRKFLEIELSDTDDTPSTSRADDQRADENTNESNENDPEMKVRDEGRKSETDEPGTRDGLEKKGKGSNDSQNDKSSSDNNQDDNDDDDFDGHQRPNRINAEPEKTLVIEINLKDGTQTRSYVNLDAPGRSVDNLLSHGVRDFGQTFNSEDCSNEDPVSTEKTVKEDISNVEDKNVVIPKVGNQNAEIQNERKENDENPNWGNENGENINVRNENEAIPNVGNENAENPNQPNENRDTPPIQNRNNEANGAPPNPGENGDLDMDCLKIDSILNFGEVRYNEHGEVIVVASAKRAKMQPTQAVGPQPNDGPVASGFGSDRVMIINCSWEQGKRQRKQTKARPQGEAQAPAQAQPQAPAPAQAQGQAEGPAQQVNEGASTSRDNPRPRVENPVDYRIEPRHHVLYVNVGHHTSTYRFPREFDAPGFPRISEVNVQRQHVDPSALVTDFAIRRFGRADGEDVNIIHLGPNGPVVVGGQDPGARPDRSTLRFLSVNGYRNITDRSLTHLATAAPYLQHIDFSGTSVSDAGAETFRSLRPDCCLIYSKFTEEGEE